MGDEGDKALAGLQSAKSVQRLEQISALRARGIGENIDLPQLVVCGDQSAGKSSVLEGITGIPFPREEGVCTKFATEVILEHAEGTSSILATIIPHASRSEQLKTALQAFTRTISGFEELPEVIAKAGALMGIRGYGDNITGPAFVEDVLRIKVTGPSGLHLSIVDLPGLIANASEDQTEEDVLTVHRMVDSYVEKPRTIILAVVQAGNDVANQSIIRKSKHFDKAGQRTVGIITKPDLVNDGAQASIAALAKNQGTTRLKLGFFLLKNPTPRERESDMTAQMRSVAEVRFFGSSPWKEQNLDAGRVGIDRLKSYLQTLLDHHIENELPKVRDEIKALARNTEEELALSPTERPTTGHLRMFLSELAMRYHNLASAALSGDYHTGNSTFFATEGARVPPVRLRAAVHVCNTEYSDFMRNRGQQMQAQSSESDEKPPPPPLEDIPDLSPPEPEKSTEESASTSRPRSHTSVLEEALSESSQRTVSKTDMVAWVKDVYLTTRGRELPGNYNHVLLSELFHQQSKLWQDISFAHIRKVDEIVMLFVMRAILHLRAEAHVLAEMKDEMTYRLEVRLKEATAEMQRLWDDELQQPITYNHYYTDNVQNARLKSTQQALEHALQGSTDATGENMTTTNAKHIMSLMQNNITINMDEQACTEALDGLNAYYKVALKTFVDNVCKQVIERHLLRGLPDIFSPQIVAMYSDEDLQRIAGERSDVIEKRKQLREQLTNLRAALEELKK